MILQINTQDQKTVTVSLKNDGKMIKSLSEQNEYGSQVLLPLIIKLFRIHNPGLLTQNQTGFGKLTGIKVSTGPGSFTGLRVGVSVANALGFSLNIPVNGKKIEDNLVY